MKDKSIGLMWLLDVKMADKPGAPGSSQEALSRTEAGLRVVFPTVDDVSVKETKSGWWLTGMLSGDRALSLRWVQGKQHLFGTLDKVVEGQGEQSVDLGLMTAALTRMLLGSSEADSELKSHDMDTPPISFGNEVKRYYPMVDDCLVEYDFDKIAFEETTPYQHVRISHSHQFGNILILDGDINLGESDLIYTQTILGAPNIPLSEYKDKKVLILGGGDGGCLHEVLKGAPAKVIMAEIDAVVLDAAAKHLRGICGSSLDSLTGPNYEVVVGDCVPLLKSYIAAGDKFDFIINDLTAIPVDSTGASEHMGSEWEFLKLILDLSMQVMAPGAVYITQGNSYNAPQALESYERLLAGLTPQVAWHREPAYVPSYHERWVFMSLWRAEDENLSGTAAHLLSSKLKKAQ